jgi:hypothetical protein
MNTNCLKNKISTLIKTIRLCSNCKKEGHNKRTCKTINNNVKTIKPKNKILTEDTGKMFEMSICLAYGIPYNGIYKYSMKIPESIKNRLSKLIDLFPLCLHSGNNGGRYDYTSVIDKTKHLSAKSSKKGTGKICPQVIGQSQPKKFCEIIGIDFINVYTLKHYIQII